MSGRTWLQRLFCACPDGHRACAPVGVEPATQSQAKPPVPSAVVPLTSPARALERSLTDPETRGEWTYQWMGDGLSQGYARYRNEARDITLSRHYGLGYSLSTPFTLNKAEKEVVEQALATFDARRHAAAELAALSRLTAQGIEARSDETRSGSAVGESPVPNGDAPNA